MNLYVISTGSYSDYIEIKLTHEQKFTAEEFKEMCIKVCADLEGNRVDDHYLNEEMVVDEVINRYGFKKISFINCHIWDYSYDKDITVSEE